jgi:1-acyl-sn-glycerol-3-phosphate acyltransferase
MPTWIWSVASVAYALPLLKFFLSLARKVFFLTVAPKGFRPESPARFFWLKNSLHGMVYFEYLFQPLRYYFIGLPVTVIFLFGLGRIFFSTVSQDSLDFSLLCWAGLTVLIHWHRHSKVMADIKAVECLRAFPQIHPQCFFTRYFWELALGGIDFSLPSALPNISPEQASFCQDVRPGQSIYPMMRGIFDTAYLAHMGLVALERVGPHYCADVFDAIWMMWGKRNLAMAKASFSISGTENVEGRHGRFFLIFNHKSQFDFILTFFALSEIRVNDGRNLSPRFIVAKDHFKDNKFIYGFLGLGRLIEAGKMIFIARKDRTQSFANLKAAARAMIDHDVDIAIYPQGTRADGVLDRSGKRRDAGYYTTFSAKDKTSPLSHLKKGTGYLVFDILETLQREKIDDDLHLVFIGIKGAATTLPKRSLRVQSENEIHFSIGDVVTLNPQMISAVTQGDLDEEDYRQKRMEFAGEVNQLVNDRLVDILNLRDVLMQRYLTDLKGQFRYDEDKIQMIAKALVRASVGTDIVFQILDRLYALPVNLWNGYLSQLGQLLLEGVSQKRLEALLNEVSDVLLR